MSQELPSPEHKSTIQNGAENLENKSFYDQIASVQSKTAIFIWCLVGWIYAAYTWHLLWLPGVLIFFPGIFIASLIAAIFFIPRWFIWKKAKEDFEIYGKRRWRLLIFGTLLNIGGFIGPIAGVIGYVHLLRYLIR